MNDLLYFNYKNYDVHINLKDITSKEYLKCDIRNKEYGFGFCFSRHCNKVIDRTFHTGIFSIKEVSYDEDYMIQDTVEELQKDAKILIDTLCGFEALIKNKISN